MNKVLNKKSIKVVTKNGESKETSRTFNNVALQATNENIVQFGRIVAQLCGEEFIDIVVTDINTVSQAA